ncbi:uncharacterized protein LOC143257128 isoform X2 [Tachypleus tridentatus]|uniref:uncharacterized protein LOC143257128 isoform X2 n=1 Tax=Tachypleus tridentatus TaxID=6853 RepID=UPI003FD5C66E
MSLVSNVTNKNGSATTENVPELYVNKCLNDRSCQSQESICFEELAELISASLADMSSLSVKPEKCAIIQETVSQIHRIQQQQAAGERDELQESEVSSSNSSILNSEVLGPLLLEALDGFLLLVNTDGKIEVVSENISYFLKFTKDDLVGKSIYNIIHVGDHARFSSSLLPMSIGNGFGWTPESGTSKGRTFNCRFLIKPREDTEESMEEKQTQVSQYESMQISTVLLPHPAKCSDSSEAATSDVQNLLFCVARRIPPNEQNQSPVGIEQFTTRLDVRGKILAIDTSGVSSTYSQYLNKDLVERIIQELCHPTDLQKLNQHLKETLQVGSNTSGIYRLKVAHEKYIHVQTKSKRVAYNPATSEQEFIMASHSIISGDNDLLDAGQQNGGLSSSNSVRVGGHTSAAITTTPVNGPSSNVLYSSLTSLPSASHDFNLDDFGLDLFPSSSWELTTENSREDLTSGNSLPNPSPATSASSSGSNVRGTLVGEVQLTHSAFPNEISPIVQSPPSQLTSPCNVSQVTSHNIYSFSPPLNGRVTPASLGSKQVEDKKFVVSDVNCGKRNMPFLSYSNHQPTARTNPKLRNLLTQGTERMGSPTGVTSFSKLFRDRGDFQKIHPTGLENGLIKRGVTDEDNSSSSSKNVILRELLNQDEDAMSEPPNKSCFPSSDSKSGMSFKADPSIESSKRRVNNNNMLRKLLNSEMEGAQNNRRSHDTLIQQLLKAESPEKNENTVRGDTNSQSSSTDQLFKDLSLNSNQPNTSPLPTSLGAIFGSVSKRKSDDNVDPPSKRPAVQHPHLAGQNPMLASMLAQTPKTEPSVPTTIANSIMSQLPQDRLPKNLEKKLIQTPCTIVTSVSSNNSTHPASTSLSQLHQDVITADSRGHVTLAQHSTTTLNISQGRATLSPQNGTQPNHHQGFLNRILTNTDSSQLTRTLAVASANATNLNQLGQNTYSNLQPRGQLAQQPSKSLTLADLLGDVSSFDSIVGLTAQSQTSDPMLSQILDEVCSMQQEMEPSVLDDNMLLKILDEVFEQPVGPSTAGSSPSNSRPVQDVHEKLAINAIQQQLMSYETSSSRGPATSHSAQPSFHTQASSMALGVVPSSTVNYPSGSTPSAGYRVRLQDPGVLAGIQQSVTLGNYQRPVGVQHPNSANLTPEVYQRLLERRQKMLRHQKRLRVQHQQVVQVPQTVTESLNSTPSPVFTDNMNDLLNNTVVPPNVTLQHFSGVPDQQISPRYNGTLISQNNPSQLSPGQQSPYSPLSQQSLSSASPPVTSSYPHPRLTSYSPASPLPVPGEGPRSPHVQAISPQPPWNQGTATTGSVQQQNPMLNAQLSQSSFASQGRFVTKVQRQLPVRSMHSPNSVTSQRNALFPCQSDGQFRPQSPGHLYRQASQVQSKQRMQRTVSIPSHVNSPRTPHGGFVGGDQVISPQPQMSSVYNSQSVHGNNYASSDGTTDNSHFSFDHQDLQLFDSSLVDRRQVAGNDNSRMTSEYVRQELRAMVGAKTQQQQAQGQQLHQYVLGGGGLSSTSGHHTFNPVELDELVLSLDLETATDGSPGLFPPPNNHSTLTQVPSHSSRDEEPKPADQKKSLLQQLLQHTPEPC